MNEPQTPQEALLAVVDAWAGSFTHSQRVRLYESITRIVIERPALPVEMAGELAEGRN